MRTGIWTPYPCPPTEQAMNIFLMMFGSFQKVILYLLNMYQGLAYIESAYMLVFNLILNPSALLIILCLR